MLVLENAIALAESSGLAFRFYCLFATTLNLSQVSDDSVIILNLLSYYKNFNYLLVNSLPSHSLKWHIKSFPYGSLILSKLSSARLTVIKIFPPVFWLWFNSMTCQNTGRNILTTSHPTDDVLDKIKGSGNYTIHHFNPALVIHGILFCIQLLS